jgi:hypothetical protein
MRKWQVERRKRTRHLIELGGLIVKARLVELTGDDRATIYGALLWMADKLQSDQGEHARELWIAKGKQAFGRTRRHTRGQIEVFQQFVVDAPQSYVSRATTRPKRRWTMRWRWKRRRSRPAAP